MKGLTTFVKLECLPENLSKLLNLPLLGQITEADRQLPGIFDSILVQERLKTPKKMKR